MYDNEIPAKLHPRPAAVWPRLRGANGGGPGVGEGRTERFLYKIPPHPVASTRLGYTKKTACESVIRFVVLGP